MTENETINGWTFEETIKTAENLMVEEDNMFKWDVLRHLRDFAESFKDELEQYRAIGLTPELIEAMQGHNIALINDLGEYQQIGTIEEFKALKEKSVAKKPIVEYHCGLEMRCPTCNCNVSDIEDRKWDCSCGQKLDWQ